MSEPIKIKPQYYLRYTAIWAGNWSRKTFWRRGDRLLGKKGNLACIKVQLVALGVNLLMVFLAIISIMLTVPKHKKAE